MWVYLHRLFGRETLRDESIEIWYASKSNANLRLGTVRTGSLTNNPLLVNYGGLLENSVKWVLSLSTWSHLESNFLVMRIITPILFLTKTLILDPQHPSSWVSTRRNGATRNTNPQFETFLPKRCINEHTFIFSTERLYTHMHHTINKERKWESGNQLTRELRPTRIVHLLLYIGKGFFVSFLNLANLTHLWGKDFCPRVSRTRGVVQVSEVSWRRMRIQLPPSVIQSHLLQVPQCEAKNRIPHIHTRSHIERQLEQESTL